jgi:hypothetical protein
VAALHLARAGAGSVERVHPELLRLAPELPAPLRRSRPAVREAAANRTQQGIELSRTVGRALPYRAFFAGRGVGHPIFRCGGGW